MLKQLTKKVPYFFLLLEFEKNILTELMKNVIKYKTNLSVF